MDLSEDDSEPPTDNFAEMGLDDSSEEDSKDSTWCPESEEENEVLMEYVEDSDRNNKEEAYVTYDNPWEDERMMEAENINDSDKREREVARIMVEMYASDLGASNHSKSSSEGNEDVEGLFLDNEDEDPTPDLMRSYHVEQDLPSSFIVTTDENSGALTVVRVGRSYNNGPTVFGRNAEVTITPEEYQGLTNE
jgi:hypothetical protein